jgi:hypothetical protein
MALDTIGGLGRWPSIEQKRFPNQEQTPNLQEIPQALRINKW